MIELSFFQGHGSSPASSPELQREPTHQEKIRQLVSHVQKSTDKKNEKAPPEDEDKHDKSKLTEDEYSKLPEPEASLLFGKQLALSLISKDTKKKGYFYI